MTRSGTLLGSACVWGPVAPLFFFFFCILLFFQNVVFCSLPLLSSSSLSSFLLLFLLLLFHAVSMCLFYLAADSQQAVHSLTGSYPEADVTFMPPFLKCPAPNSIEAPPQNSSLPSSLPTLPTTARPSPTQNPPPAAGPEGRLVLRSHHVTPIHSSI